MCDLIVSVPDHCLSFYFVRLAPSTFWFCHCDEYNFVFL